MEGRQREVFVNVPVHRSVPETCFEETRIRDYITAYQTTGQPPQPIPAEPVDLAERARLGLPPPWVPYSEVNGMPVPLDKQTMQSIQNIQNTKSTQSLQNGSPQQPITDLTGLPDVQEFAPTASPDEIGQPQYMQTITCQHAFSAFSPEELRYRAYWVGKKYAPEAVQKAEAAAAAAPAATPPTFSFRTTATLNGVGDTFQSITCQPPYAGHSFEELRLACYRTRRELTSEQISAARVL
ncbi:hypothetical protein PsYK624_144260 [Phanerochaete sordida]|uniref:Uncharacterized protein n=1 Tax=Phanerochaete sordida TaxID=48140 RepID=A0A9P3LK66_9APHY|nr:hypothetical protein PsYK624_144260 [Phanerochaete sordida]